MRSNYHCLTYKKVIKMYIKVKDRKKCDYYNGLISDKIDDSFINFKIKYKKDNSFGFIQKKDKGYDVRCSFCNKTMIKLKAKSNQKCECENCGATLTLTRKYEKTRESFLGYIEQINDDLYCARYFYNSITAYKSFNNSTEYFDEVKREFYSLNDGLQLSCHKGMGQNMYNVVFSKKYNEWIPDDKYPYNNTICASNIYCYFCPELIPDFDGCFKYCSFKEVAKNGWTTNFNGHMDLYKKYPQVEFAIKNKWKNGYYQYKEIINQIDFKNKKSLRNCIKNDYNSRNCFLSNYDVKEEDKNLFEKCTFNSLKASIEKYGYNNTVKALKKGYELNLWKDYLEALKIIDVAIDKEIMFPSDLLEAHDRTIARKIAVENKIYDENIKKYAEELNIKVENKKYKIIVPESSKEIIHEGEMQHNCVGKMGYIEKMASRSTIICFLRKSEEPNKSFVTIELDPNRKVIRQAYAERNHKCPEDALAFIKKNLLTREKEGIVNA